MTKVYEVSSTTTYVSSPYSAVSETYEGFVDLGSVYALETYGYDATFLTNSTPYGTANEIDASPYGIDSEYPQSVGMQWTDNYAFTYATAYDISPSRTQTDTESVRADGAYVSDSKYSVLNDFADDVRKVYGNGTGTQTLVQSTHPTEKYAYGKPFDNETGEVIPVKFDKVTTYVPDWFPGGAAPLKPLSYYSTDITSFAKAPRKCGGQAGQMVYDVHESGYELDPVRGTYTTSTSDEYDSPTVGLVCSVRQVQIAYYDNASSGVLTATTSDTALSILTGARLSSSHFGKTAPITAGVFGMDLRSRVRAMLRNSHDPGTALGLERPL